MWCLSSISSSLFLSTPSARRATLRSGAQLIYQPISIHALREEGDYARKGRAEQEKISIHALREEGDRYPAGLQGYC